MEFLHSTTTFKWGPILDGSGDIVLKRGSDPRMMRISGHDGVCFHRFAMSFSEAKRDGAIESYWLSMSHQLEKANG